jgi:ribosomal protein L20
MKPEDTLRIAYEVWSTDKWAHAQIERLERFTALVEKEVKREASFDRAELWLKRINKAVEEEREACAKILDANAQACNQVMRAVLKSNAAAIRARGQDAA